MATDLVLPRAAQAVKPLPFFRWICLAALLAGEVLALTLRFDTVTLASEKGLWADLLGEAHHLPALAAAVVSAMLLLGGSRLCEELQQVASLLRQPGRIWPFLFGHLTTYVLFAWLTARVLEGNVRSSPHPEAWAVAWFGLGTLTLTLWGLAVLPGLVWWRLARRCALPLVASLGVGAAAWGAGQLTDTLWMPLANSTFWIVYRLLSLVCHEIILDPEHFIVGTPAFRVCVRPECSGYEGMGLLWVFLAAYLWYFRAGLRFPHALLLLPLGTAVVYLTNAGRIATLVLVGTYLSPAVASGGFHSQAGWLAFNAVALGLVALTRRLRFFSPAEATADIAHGAAPAEAYLVPLLAVVAVTMLNAAFSAGFDGLYPLRVVVLAAALCWFHRDYAELKWSWSWTGPLLGVGVFGLWLALEPAASGNALETGLAALPPSWAIVWLVFRVFGSVVTVPLAEELAFRGYLLRRLQGIAFHEVSLQRFTWLSFVLSSALFGALHGRWLAGTLAGMVYALAVYRRGKLVDGVVAHGVTNALIAGYVLATGNWSMWS